MKLKSKTILKNLLLILMGCGILVPMALANPLDELTPDQPLYQRVKKLGDWGLLDPQDQAILDQGKIVTRLDLAFYTEKAKARISAPPDATPQPAPSPAVPPPAMSPPVMQAPAPVLPPPTITPAINEEVNKLLKELKEEVAYLKMRLTLGDQRLKDREKELDALQPIQDEINEIFKTADKKTGSPSFDSVTRLHFEDIDFTGAGGAPASVVSVPNPPPGKDFQAGSLPTANAVRVFQETMVRMITDLGGHGSFSVGLGGALSDSNASVNNLEGSGPVSLILIAPDLSLNLNGPLGQWNTHFMMQGYPGALTFGDFSRGVAPIFISRFEDPFDIRHFTDDKNMKIWDDYMSNISAPQPSFSAGTISSTYDSVFSGAYAVGNNLLGLGGDARLTTLIGRMGTSNIQTQRWEEGAKLDGSLTDNIRAAISTEWVNDHFANTIGPNLDLKGVENDYYFNFSPVTISLEGGYSSLYTGYDNITPENVLGTPTNTGLEGFAGQASISLYPLNFYYFAIDQNYSNFQSKIAMSGVDFYKYGVNFSPSSYADVYGWVGEVDNLESDRYGWRANLGWNGRQQDWMKNLPSFLDNFVVNFDVSQKHEYVVEYDQNGYNDIEVLNMTSLYYGDDEGLWGLNFWGGYGPGGLGSPWYDTRQDYIDNIEAIRNDGDLAFDDVRYKSNMSSERIPFIVPAYANGQPILPFNSNNQPTVNGATGLNNYYILPDLKTYDYITLTTKVQLNKFLNSTTPFYGSFFFTDNSVSGQSNSSMTPSAFQNIPNLFNQTVFDVAGMYQLFRNVNVMADRGWEMWTSDYTYPLVNYRYDSLGAGFAYDFPWGGGKWEFRFKHFTFTDQYVPLNNYSANQFFSTMSFLF